MLARNEVFATGRAVEEVSCAWTPAKKDLLVMLSLSLIPDSNCFPYSHAQQPKFKLSVSVTGSLWGIEGPQRFSTAWKSELLSTTIPVASGLCRSCCICASTESLFALTAQRDSGDEPKRQSQKENQGHN